MAAALSLSLFLFLTFASPTAAAKHSPTRTGGTGTTPSAPAPYGEEAQTETPAATEAPTSGTVPTSSEGNGQPVTGGEKEKGKSKSSATKGQTKVKHAPKRTEPKTPKKTPEAPVAAVAEPPPPPVSTTTPTETVSAPVSAPVHTAPTTTAHTSHSPTRARTATGSGARSHRSSRSPAAPRRVASGSAGSSTSGAALAAATRGASTPATAVGRHGSESSAVRQLSSERRPSAATSGLPLVRSVTRIINVVPPLIRVLIGVLIGLALLLAISSRVTASRARRLLRQREELLDDVGLLQAALLPPLPERIGPIATSAAYQPASGPGAGGDFYDVFALGDGRIAVILGDVSGHGRDALPQTTLLRFTLRAYIEAGLSPRAALATAGPVLERQLGSSFATVAIAMYDPRERTLVFSCAGHPPPLVLGSDAAAPITSASAPPIGVGAPTGTRQTTVTIPGAALACFYTDGVVEARTGGKLFGSRRLQRVLASIAENATAETLLDRIDAETDARPDDMAACILRMEGGEEPPIVSIEELELDMHGLERDRATRFLRAAGVPAGEIEEVVAELRREIARHGRVVLELHLGQGTPEIVLSPQNVATLTPTIRAAAGAQGALT